MQAGRTDALFCVPATSIRFPVPRRSAKVTLHDVAAAADVSIASASRALNGLYVSKAIAARVAAAAAKLGYVPNETARALRNERSLTLGVIFFELSTARGLGLLDALTAQVEAAGYSLLIATARGDARAYSLLLKRFTERRVDGLFCVSPDGDAESADLCARAGIPILALRTRGSAFAHLPLVEGAFATAAAECTRDLHALGHRRLAFIDDENPAGSFSARNPGWHKSPFRVERVRLADITRIDVWVREMLARREPPTVIAASEPQAEALLAVCRSAGIAVPQDLSIIAASTAGDESRAERLALSSILLDSHRLGDAAGKTMLDWLDGRKPRAITTVEVGRWVPRSTTDTAPVAKRAVRSARRSA
jgi:LacI family transcriptional regulator